jgi:hypothetical protein
MPSGTSSLVVRIFDGTRSLLRVGPRILVRVIDGHQAEQRADYFQANDIRLDGLPFYDNFGDSYIVIASAHACRQAGASVTLSPAEIKVVDVMLVPNSARFDFASAAWDVTKRTLPFLAQGVSDADGRTRYEQLIATSPSRLAALLNITTAMCHIDLPKGNACTYLREIRWDDSLAQDRFFAYCDADMVADVRAEAARGRFAEEEDPGAFHPGATASWKQVQFDMGNVQLTFHEGDTKVIDGVPCVLVEPDIDLYRDLLEHGLLEVIPNKITHGLTNPEIVYALRWSAGQEADAPEFSPPYTILNASA